MQPNLATVYSPRVSERLVAASVVGRLTNQNYKFIGAATIEIYSVDNMPLNDYQRTSGSQRFGNAGNIGTSLQGFTLQEDKSFAGVVDTLDNAQQMKVLKPGAILARETREVLIPYIDAYVLQVMETAADVAGNDLIVAAGATTPSNAFTNFLALRAHSIDNQGPEDGYTAVMIASYYNDLKQSGFVLNSDIGQKILQRGFLGTVDGTPVKCAPSSRMPNSTGTGAYNVDLLITHPIATTFATVLRKFKVHQDPWGIDGTGIQGRESFDAFVDVNKIQTLTAHRIS